MIEDTTIITNGGKSSRMLVDNEDSPDQQQPVVQPKPFLKRKTKAVLLDKNP